MTGTTDSPREYILVVEDDKDLRDSLCEALELEGYAAVSAENGQAALRHLATGAQPCMILLDLMMPVMDGWTFRQELLKDAACAADSRHRDDRRHAQRAPRRSRRTQSSTNRCTWAG